MACTQRNLFGFTQYDEKCQFFGGGVARPALAWSWLDPGWGEGHVLLQLPGFHLIWPRSSVPTRCAGERSAAYTISPWSQSDTLLPW